MRATILAALLALGAAACVKESEQTPAAAAPPASAADDQVAQIASAGPQAVEATIDWEAARSDRAKAPNGDVVSIQQVNPNSTPPKVPVLLPSGIVQAQNARPPAVVTTGDGYFATYNLPKYDAIVNGSAQAYAASGGKAVDKSAMKFTTGEASAQLSFSRYGADYLIEFECREVDGADSCITEDEAKAFADSLFVQQTQ
jgi:hypothetical protein